MNEASQAASMPESARLAECHTFDDGTAFPHICLADDCPARPYLAGQHISDSRVIGVIRYGE